MIVRLLRRDEMVVARIQAVIKRGPSAKTWPIEKSSKCLMMVISASTNVPSPWRRPGQSLAVVEYEGSLIPAFAGMTGYC
jgi:hypothetical protein